MPIWSAHCGKDGSGEPSTKMPNPQLNVLDLKFLNKTFQKMS